MGSMAVVVQHDEHQTRLRLKSYRGNDLGSWGSADKRRCFILGQRALCPPDTFPGLHKAVRTTPQELQMDSHHPMSCVTPFLGYRTLVVVIGIPVVIASPPKLGGDSAGWHAAWQLALASEKSHVPGQCYPLLQLCSGNIQYLPGCIR